MRYKPFQYQHVAFAHIMAYKGAGLMLEMGLGKTVATLTAILELLHTKQVKKVLVIAPLKVAQAVWPDEIEKWNHLHVLSYSLVLGDEKQRKRALQVPADIYIINRENVQWLVDQYETKFSFDMVVVDESSSFKDPRSRRFRALKKVMPLVKRTVILTGTPTPQSYLDLWSQIYLLDRGERLGITFTEYRQKYFEPAARNGHIIYDYRFKRDTREARDLIGDDVQERIIFEKLSDICISMKTRDYLSLPDRIDRDVMVHLSPAVMSQYRDFEKNSVLQLLSSDEPVTALSAGAMAVKLLQFANGAIYTDDGGKYEQIHTEKLQRLEELVDVASSPVLVFYSYRHDLDRIKTYLQKYKPVVLRGTAEINDWNKGRIHLMIAHPATAGHGLNLQAGGNNVLWFGVPVPRSLELYLQGIARLDRMGQTKSVVNQRIICQGTLDEQAYEGLDAKADMQELFMRIIKVKIKQYQI